MSDEDRRASGSDNGEEVARRVGNAERDEAIAILDEHWHAGRLDPGEHELRVTRARAAVTQPDLDVLFTDLPRTAPAGESPGAVTATGAGGFLEGKRETIMALAPFAALILFFVTRSWLWFLMVPVMGILMFGPGGKESPRQQGRRQRTQDRDR